GQRATGGIMMSTQRITTCILLAAVSSLNGCASAKQEVRTPPIQNAELAQLFKDDQADRSGGLGTTNWIEVSARDDQRRERVRKILAEGGVKLSDDYYHAAMVFQHGKDVPDFQLSHQLAVKAAELDPANKHALWLAAASKDRELMNLGKP